MGLLEIFQLQLPAVSGNEVNENTVEGLRRKTMIQNRQKKSPCKAEAITSDPFQTKLSWFIITMKIVII